MGFPAYETQHSCLFQRVTLRGNKGFGEQDKSMWGRPGHNQRDTQLPKHCFPLSRSQTSCYTRPQVRSSRTHFLESHLRYPKGSTIKNDSRPFKGGVAVERRPLCPSTAAESCDLPAPSSAGRTAWCRHAKSWRAEPWSGDTHLAGEADVTYQPKASLDLNLSLTHLF